MRYLISRERERYCNIGLEPTPKHDEAGRLAWMRIGPQGVTVYSFATRIGPCNFKDDNGKEFATSQSGYADKAWSDFLKTWRG